MEQFYETMKAFIDSAGWFAPVLFILLHLIRPLLFLPVVVVCITGGVLFGFVKGVLLSYIGLSILALSTYWMVDQSPKFKAKIDRLKEKFMHDKTISLGQVMVLRVMPFVSFNLLSVYLMEMTKSYKEYALYSLLGLIAPAVLYTAFGNAISTLSWLTMLLLLLVLVTVYFFVGKVHKSRTTAD
ncbi:TVP38/TMEM64 family protein [Planococcus lenghuensis]|uniref:TVP38/TMEM64 family membrane protein n=1 Tax=Planococcus lenghuensis TaxID=2213202 RepID=A0A1Q2L4U1_9BACL|nr:VTT domain-containing protein [Planococcus lenghuensis]AQQ55475.1 TVP38/TMEM64 family protein [Planococcus lenghuensis]